MSIVYETIEAYPISNHELFELEYETLFQSTILKQKFKEIHNNDWDHLVALYYFFRFKKVKAKLEEFSFEREIFNIIYFDAFGPRVQEEMWTQEIFKKLYDSLKDGGVFVTYCAKGQVKRDLKSVGFEVETLPGPPGKREMTRGIKRI